MKSKTLFVIVDIIWWLLLVILAFVVVDFFNAEVITKGDNLIYIFIGMLSAICLNVRLQLYAEDKQITEDDD